MDLLRHLRFFAAVAEHRHFTHAADALGMSQPPVSQGLQRLERHLGQRLFHRDARGVRLTEVGAELLPMARRLIDDAERLVVTAHRWQPTTQPRLGLAGDLEERIPQLLASLSATGWQLAPTVAGTTDLIEGLRAGDLDAAVLRHPSVADGLRAGPVLTLATQLVGPPGSSSDAATPPVSVLGRPEPLITPPRRHHPAAHDQLVDALRRAGHDGNTLEAETAADRLAWWSAGHGFRLSLQPGEHSPTQELPPVRVRVVAPVPAERRPNLDHDSLVEDLHRAIS